MAYEITRASPIGELVLNCPVAASVLLEHGFHCIGCGLAAYETIEEGAAAHGLDDAQTDALVQELRDAAKKEEELLSKVDKSLAAKPSTAAKPAAAKAPSAKENKTAGKKKP